MSTYKPTILEFGWGTLSSTEATYEIKTRLCFLGTDVLGIPVIIKAITQITGATDGSIKIYDVTNANTICELVAFTDTVWTLKDLGTLSNLPTGESIFEVQLKRNGSGAQSVDLAALSIIF